MEPVASYSISLHSHNDDLMTCFAFISPTFFYSFSSFILFNCSSSHYVPFLCVIKCL